MLDSPDHLIFKGAPGTGRWKEEDAHCTTFFVLPLLLVSSYCQRVGLKEEQGLNDAENNGFLLLIRIKQNKTNKKYPIGKNSSSRTGKAGLGMAGHGLARLDTKGTYDDELEE